MTALFPPVPQGSPPSETKEPASPATPPEAEEATSPPAEARPLPWPMRPAGFGEVVAAAEDAVLLSSGDPQMALARGRSVVRLAERTGNREAATVAWRAMALASRELGDLPLAEEYLQRAIRAGEGVPRRAAQARLSLVTVRTERGHPADALAIADAAEPYLDRVERAKLGVQRAVALMRLGRHREAVGHCDRAVEVLKGACGPDERRFLAGALLNRALANAWLGRHRRARADLTACLSVARAAGLGHMVALAEANRPFLAARRGDIPSAFASYREAVAALERYPERLAALRCDLAGALLAAHLPGEARALLDLAVPALEAAGARSELADARLLLARLELAAGMPHKAMATAEAARAELTEQRRDAAMADDTILRARLAVTGPAPDLLAAMLACADTLAETGQALPAAALRLTAAETALRLGDTATASRCLDLLAPAKSAGAAGETAQTLVREHAAALAAVLRKDRRAAFAAVARGLRAVGASSARMDDPVTRAHAVKAGEGLAAFGVSLAVATGCGRTVLDWAERWRGVAATGRPGVLNQNILRRELARLARHEPRPTETPPPDRATGQPTPLGKAHSHHPSRPQGTLRSDHGDGAGLVEYVRDRKELVAVVVTVGGVSLRRLGPVSAVADATARLRYALRRACLRDGAHDREAVDREAEIVDALLVRPLATALPGGPLVVVPAGPLHTLPWPVLPSLRGRPICVAGAAASWVRGVRRAAAEVPDTVSVVAVAGPGLAHARAEAAAVTACHPGGRTVRARVRDVLEALDTAHVVHLAAHGTFHAGSPLLSGITLDDGPLMAYDLYRLRTPARLVVLSACDTGMAHAPADGAPLGLAGMFLRRGTACVVAGMVPVRDDDAAALMAAFHTAIAAGRPPAHALAEASTATGVAGFVCFGAGGVPLSLRSRPDGPAT